MNIDEFLIELEKTPRRWVNLSGALRILPSGDSMQRECPISAVVKQSRLYRECYNGYANGPFVGPRDFAQKCLGMDNETAKQIQGAADWDCQSYSELRQRLFKACGL